jgi:hypothetical protein
MLAIMLNYMFFAMTDAPASFKRSCNIILSHAKVTPESTYHLSITKESIETYTELLSYVETLDPSKFPSVPGDIYYVM